MRTTPTGSPRSRLKLVVGQIFLASAICVIRLFAVTEQIWLLVIAAVCWLAIVLWFRWPRRDDEVQEVGTTSSDTFDAR
jgi:hypothetical protein